MSRRQNNLRRMRAARRLARQRRMAAAGPAGEASTHGDTEGRTEMDSTGTEGGGAGVVHVDRMTGEVRLGGPELWKELQANLVREREMFLASDNPCYLVGRVGQKEGAFDAEEIKRMVDATFECASRGSPDAWYPNQYALSLAHATLEDAADEVEYFLSNFGLGLRTSGERAARHLGQGDWLGESRRLDARLEAFGATGELTGGDLLDIVAHAAGHPLFAEAMSWYERGSGRKMRRDAPADDGETGTDGCPEAQRRQEALADIEFWRNLVRSEGRDTVIDDLVRGNFCLWLCSDTDHKLYIRASNEAGVRELLRSYSDSELGEWFSLMTTLVLKETILQVGMRWKQLGRDDPVLLVEYPPLEELRTLLNAA